MFHQRTSDTHKTIKQEYTYCIFLLHSQQTMTRTVSNFQYDLVFVSHFSIVMCVFCFIALLILVIALRTSFFCSFFAVSLRSYLHVCFTVYLFSHFNSVIAVFFIFIFYTLTLQLCLKCILLANKMNFCKKEMHIKPSALNTTTIKKIPLSCFQIMLSLIAFRIATLQL